MIHYESIFPVLFGVISTCVLALALTSIGSLLNGVHFATVTASNIVNVLGDHECLYLFTGIIVITAISFVISVSCIHLLSKVSSKSFDTIAMTGLALLLMVGVGMFCLVNIYVVIVYFLVAATLILVTRIFSNRMRLSIAIFNIASRAMLELPKLSLYCMITIFVYIFWFVIWLVAAYGLALANSTDIFLSNGAAIRRNECTSYSYTQVNTFIAAVLFVSLTFARRLQLSSIFS
jgi:hypothetical protein